MHQKTTVSNYIFSRLGGHMAASLTHGRFSGISWTLSIIIINYQNRAYFLASNPRHCMIIVSIKYSLSLSLIPHNKCCKYSSSISCNITVGLLQQHIHWSPNHHHPQIATMSHNAAARIINRALRHEHITHILKE